MNNIRAIIAQAETAAIAVESRKSELEAARRRVEELKVELDAAKAALEDAYAKCEEAGLPKAKARKVVEEIVRVLSEAGIADVGEDVPAAEVPPTRQPVQRRRRKSVDESAEAEAATPPAGTVEGQAVSTAGSAAVGVAVSAETRSSGHETITATEAADPALSPAAGEMTVATPTSSNDGHAADDGNDDDVDSDGAYDYVGDYDDAPDVDLFGGDDEPDEFQEEPVGEVKETTAPAAPSVSTPVDGAGPKPTVTGFRRPSFLNR